MKIEVVRERGEERDRRTERGEGERGRERKRREGERYREER